MSYKEGDDVNKSANLKTPEKSHGTQELVGYTKDNIIRRVILRMR